MDDEHKIYINDENKKIWLEWRRMHFHGKTLLARLDVIDEWSAEGGAISRELDEINAQLADMEDDNSGWLPELIQNELY